jgi:branched-subunit amino acid aminotransferase/4-amino-4-deoxychorismate lyase
VERASLLASGAIVEAYVRVDDLHRTEALWLINSVRGWMRAEWLHSPSRSL